jgi:hypothetical protein
VKYTPGESPKKYPRANTDSLSLSTALEQTLVGSWKNVFLGTLGARQAATASAETGHDRHYACMTQDWLRIGTPTHTLTIA